MSAYKRPLHVPVTHKIKAWRKYKGLTANALADKAGVSASMISHLEQGKAGYTQKTLEALAEALDVLPCMLLCIEPPNQGEKPNEP
jgi:transcriptional regulator with XRE-family HTH domain